MSPRSRRWPAPSLASIPAAFVVAALALVTCRESEPTGVTRAEVVASLATTVIVPHYAALSGSAPALAEATRALCEAPDAARLSAAQQAWREVRLPLARAKAHPFGPIEDERIDSAVDFWPVRTDAVEATLAAGEEPTPETLATLGVASKGLPVIEYLLFDPEGGDAAVLASLDASTDEGQYRCAYAVALADDVQTQTAALFAAWDPDQGDWAAQLTQAGAGSERFMTVQMALDTVVAQLAFSLQEIADTELGDPLGHASGGIPQPELVPSRFSSHAVAELRATLEGAWDVYAGRGEGPSEDPSEGLGLRDIVIPHDPELDAAIEAQFEATQQALQAIDQPLTQMVQTSPGPVEVTREEVLGLRRLIEVDLAGLLGVTIGLSDNDGD